MNLYILINSVIAISMFVTIIKFFNSGNSYDRILYFYLIFTQFIVLFIGISRLEFENIFDIVIILLLLKLVAILYLLLNKKKI